MPSRPVHTRGGVVHAAMSDLMLTHGVTGLTMRAIAAGTGIAPSTLVNQFTGRRRLLSWFAAWTARERLHVWDDQVFRHGLGGLLPRSPEALALESVWAGIAELGRRDDPVSEVVHLHVDEERSFVLRFLADRAAERGEPVAPGWRPPDADVVPLLTCLLAGLREVMVRRRDPLDAEEATRLLGRVVDLLDPGSAPRGVA